MFTSAKAPTASNPVFQDGPAGAGIPYRNPVLPGFYPDPSVVRVGDDFYLVNSTFQYFPSIVISHSRDMVHWQQIGHVFDERNPLGLEHFHDGCGVWAPDISYHDGWFYIFYCLVQLTKDRSTNTRGNYCVRARSPLGPFSEPVQLTADGNDPSHFVDVDGKHYLVYAAGLPLGRGTKIVELNDECTRTVGEPRWMEWGIDRRAPEGPHVFRRGGYYYHTMAAGSGRFDGHHQLIARSEQLFGPYVESPYGPFIAQHDRASPLQHHGHAKLVEHANGDWWAFYLMQRRVDGVSPLGRETGLDKVTWTNDGWPVLNEHRGPSAGAIVRGIRTRAFAGDTCPERWISIREGIPSDMVRFDAADDSIHLRCGNAWLTSVRPGSVLLRRETSHAYTAEVDISFEPNGPEEAGITCYYDTASHISFGVTGVGQTRQLLLRTCRRGVTEVVAKRPVPGRGSMRLSVRVRGLSRAFAATPDEEDRCEIGIVNDASFLSDEGTPHWGFTGTLVGIYALNHGSGHHPVARFRRYRQRND